MIVEVDLAVVPPAVALREESDFKAFKLVAKGDHAYISRDSLIALAGDAAKDPAWIANLDGMIEFAKRSGWLDDEGSVRAHVEYER